MPVKFAYYENGFMVYLGIYKTPLKPYFYMIFALK